MSTFASPSPSSKLTVLHYLSTVGMGGLENYVLTLCRYLDRNAIESRITCITHNRPEIVAEASAMDVPVHAIPPPHPGSMQRKLEYGGRLLSMVQLMRRHHVDVLHIHAIGYNGLNAIIAARLTRHPRIVVTHHQQLPPRPNGASERAVLALQKRTGARIIALFAAQARDIAATGVAPANISVVPTAVNLRAFEGVPAATASDGSLFRVCMAARFQEGKGHPHLLEAVARLVLRYPQLRLLLLGDGETRPAVEAQIRQLGLDGVVDLAGWVPNTKIPHVLRTAHATVLPTHIPTETTPIALIEGMAIGLPAIGTRWGGIPDMIVEGETGYLVEPRDVDSLARAIERLVAEPAAAFEMGRRARERVQRIFSGEALARAMSTIYREIAT